MFISKKVNGPDGPIQAKDKTLAFVRHLPARSKLDFIKQEWGISQFIESPSKVLYK